MKYDVIDDNPLSKGYRTDMKKLNEDFKFAVKERKYNNIKSKVFKISNRIFWISMFSFTMWFASGFYDLFPRMKLDEKIEKIKN